MTSICKGCQKEKVASKLAYCGGCDDGPYCSKCEFCESCDRNILCHFCEEPLNSDAVTCSACDPDELWWYHFECTIKCECGCHRLCKNKTIKADKWGTDHLCASHGCKVFVCREDGFVFDLEAPENERLFCHAHRPAAQEESISEFVKRLERETDQEFRDELAKRLKKSNQEILQSKEGKK